MPSKKIIDLDALKKFRQETDEKYVIEGEYSPNTKVGYADESGALTPYGDNSGADDNGAFVFQTTGGSSDVGALAYCRGLLGNTVGFNQLIKLNGYIYTSNGTETTVEERKRVWTINSGRTSFNANFQSTGNFSCANLIAGHKYLVKAKVKCSLATTSIAIQVNSGSSSTQVISNNNLANTYVELSGIITGASTNAPYFSATFNDTTVGTETIELSDFIITDLTLLGKEYSTVLAFNRDYPLPYYSYNAGQLLSSQTKGIKNVGYNAWDEQWEQGTIDDNGVNQVSIYAIRSKNYIKVIAGESYTMPYYKVVSNTSLATSSYRFAIFEYDENKTFIQKQTVYGNSQQSAWNMTLSNGTQYIKFYTNMEQTYANDIAIHLTWDCSRTGYEPYQVHEYAMPDIELRSNPNTGTCDELTPDGTLTNKVKIVNLGDQNWEEETLASGKNYYTDIMTDAAPQTNVFCARFTSNALSSGSIRNNAWISASKRINITADGYSSANEFKTAMANVYLIYDLATSTTKQNDAYKFQEVQQVDDFGTQQALSDQAIQVPQGFDFFYPVDYKAFLDSLGGRDDIDYDASKVVSQTELGILSNRIPALSTSADDGTYVLKATKSGSTITYAWVLEE